MSKPVIHHLNNSRSQRIVWLCEELGLDYDIVHHQRDPETQRSPASLTGVHSLGRSPTLVHEGTPLSRRTPSSNISRASWPAAA